ncbi:DUF4232 domain-containing protein [Saccharopolyspora sp. NFXS83]|uniref:DUF4232 domain-containing protein n=1 Tax=Saccharopolyspora sp. NFXS83 TaxID=2993560 RepID=UPI00224B1D16|nr:DUF4232 domain-containing protein [Saccharopolyspora sp. NFXS83]MCX2731090.1 DUF4232 domain-containing protein [Saccharopolyspora sp. NFXS83]
MTTKFRRIAAATAVAGAAFGITALTADPAVANPSDALCTSADVNVAVTKDPEHAAGHEAFLIDYTAASPTTNCKLQGVPAGVSFHAGEAPIPGVTVNPERTPAAPVNLTASKPAFSRIVQQTGAPANPTVPTSVEFDLRNGHVTAAWPTGESIKGDVLTATPIAQR